jgi:hypothetical protein
MRKFIPYILILVILMGVLAPIGNISAQTTATGICFPPSGGAPYPAANKDACNGNFLPYNDTNNKPPAGGPPEVSPAPGGAKTELEKRLTACGGWLMQGTLIGCVEKLTYIVFVSAPSLLLGVVAYFFNFSAAMTLSSTFYRADFIVTIWTIVKDFTNIFFILILLYAAFKIMLNLHHGDSGKKIVGLVVLMALVVNFSLFFTKVVIDASNMTALIFYNKIAVVGGNKYEPVNSTSVNVEQKNIAGALVSSFNVNQFFDADLLERIDRSATDQGIPSALNSYVKIGMMLIYGFVIYTLCYAFFIAGVSFFGRLMMLVMLMIVSPFAFMSYAVPSLRDKVDTLGFKSWIHKLIDTSFVATIFMFLIYLISVILDAGVFGVSKDSTTWGGILPTLIILFMPAGLIIVFLLKGVSYAKKASGEFTGAIISGAKTVGALAVGGAALGAVGVAAASRGLAGGIAKNVQNDTLRSKNLNWRGNLAKNFASPLSFANPFAYARMAGILGRGVVAKGAQKLHEQEISVAAPGGGPRIQTTIGRYFQEQESGLAHQKHGEHTIQTKTSEYAEKHHLPGGKDTKFNDLRGEEQNEVLEAIDRDLIAKKTFNQPYDKLTNVEQKDAVDEAYQELSTNRNTYTTSPTGQPYGEVRGLPINVSTRNPNYNPALPSTNPNSRQFITTPRTITGTGGREALSLAQTNATLGQILRAIRTGTHDPRNIVNAKMEGKTGFNKVAIGTLAFSANLIAAALKGLTGTSGGTGTGKFLEDLKNTISESFKLVKITIKQKTKDGKTHSEKEVKTAGH